MNEPISISSREVSEMLRRYSEIVAAQSVLLGVDRESDTAHLLYDESQRAAELASYFWNSKHDLREHYVARKAVLGDFYFDAYFPDAAYFYLPCAPYEWRAGVRR